MSGRRATASIAAAALLGLVIGGVGILARTDADRVPAAAPGAPQAGEPGGPSDSGSGFFEMWPSRTADHWVTHAEYVVDATVVSERDAREVTDKVRKAGWLGRVATLRVNDVLWTRADPTTELGKEFDLEVSGWTLGAEGDDRQESTVKGYSRLDVGHRYVLALGWLPARCSPGDEPTLEQFSPLGATGVVPFDDGALGVGEVEGSTRTLEEARAAAWPEGHPARGLRDELVGQGAEDLRVVLADAKSGDRFRVLGTPCKD